MSSGNKPGKETKPELKQEGRKAANSKTSKATANVKASKATMNYSILSRHTSNECRVLFPSKQPLVERRLATSTSYAIVDIMLPHQHL